MKYIYFVLSPIIYVCIYVYIDMSFFMKKQPCPVFVINVLAHLSTDVHNHINISHLPITMYAESNYMGIQ